MLFLAISGALALIAFAGLGPRLRNVRFTDATKAIQSDITREVMNAQAGQSRRVDGYTCTTDLVSGGPKIQAATGDARSGSAENCVVNGRIAKLAPDNVTYYSIVSFREPITSCTAPVDTFASITACFRPVVIKTEPQPQVQPYKSGMKTSQASGSVHPLWFGYVQNPNGVGKHFFTNRDGTIDTSGDVNTFTSEELVSGVAERKICLQLNERKATLTFAPGLQEPQLNTKGCS